MATIRIPDARIDYFLSEDIPYLDLTSFVLGIGEQAGSMEYFTRQECILAGTARSHAWLISLDARSTTHSQTARNSWPGRLS